MIHSSQQVAALFVLGVIVSLLALHMSGCAAPWETADRKAVQGAQTLYAGTLAGLREACRLQLFGDDPRWARACDFVADMPETLGGSAAEVPPQHVRVLPDGRVELQ